MSKSLPTVLARLKELEEKATHKPWFVMPEKVGIRNDGSQWVTDEHICYGIEGDGHETFDLEDGEGWQVDKILQAESRNSLPMLIEALEDAIEACDQCTDGNYCCGGSSREQDLCPQCEWRKKWGIDE